MTRYRPPEFDVISYARNAEDVVLLRTFADRRGGFYVDVGAGEPDSGSLTKNLVDRLGWQGVNIEPLPDRFARLVAARHRDVNLRVAVSTRPGPALFHRILPASGLEGAAGLSTLEPEIAEMHRRTGWGCEELEVEVVTLTFGAGGSRDARFRPAEDRRRRERGSSAGFGRSAAVASPSDGGGGHRTHYGHSQPRRVGAAVACCGLHPCAVRRVESLLRM